MELKIGRWHIGDHPGLKTHPVSAAEILKDGVSPGVIYLDKAFTREALEGVLGGRYPVRHIASHFEFKPGNIADSHLVLGDGDWLTLSQVTEEDYDFGGVDLITLSACNTGMPTGATGTGSEVESFGSLPGIRAPRV